MVHDASALGSNHQKGKAAYDADGYHLHEVGTFQNLPKDVLGKLNGIVRKREVRRGIILFNQFDPIYNIYLVHNGAMRLVQYTPDGQAVSLAMFGSGDMFGLMEALQERPALGTAEALKDTVLLYFPGKQFRNLVQGNPALNATVTENLTDYLFSGYERIRELSTMRVENRLANTIVRLVEKFGSLVNNNWEIDLPLSRRALAELVGTRLETVSRIMRGWEQDGFIQSKRECLTVLKLDEIRQIAEEV